MAGTRGWAEYWRDDAGGVEAMHARFRDHVYAPHSHDAYSFGITDAGAQQFHCRGALHTSNAGMVMALNPDDPHDGRAAADLGYHYRIVHVSPRLVRAVLADAGDLTEAAAALPLFAKPVLGDRRLADAIARLHAALVGTAAPGPAGRSGQTAEIALGQPGQPDQAHRADPGALPGSLIRDERLRAVILAAHLRAATRPPRLRTLTDGAQRRVAHRARALMRQAYPEPVSVDLLAEAAGCSRFALYRAFAAEFGMAPSDYERQLRLRHARSLLRLGGAPAEVAAATGFADQAHLARWFKRAYGITPGVFARGSSA